MSTFDPYHKWLGIPKAEQPPHHYRLLGIAPFESDPEVIEAAADRQMAYIRQCATGPYTKESQQILNALSAARVCLLNAAKKQAYDRELGERLAPPARAAEPSSVVAGGGADNALLLLQRSVAEGAVAQARRSPQKKKAVQPNVYWLWGGIGSVALLIVGGILYAVSQPGPQPSQSAGKEATSENAGKTARRVKKDRATAERKASSEDAAPQELEPPAKGTAITNSIGMKLVLVPAGEFQMGADESQASTFKAFPYTAAAWLEGERPRHRVRITRPFYMGACEVTVEQFLKFYDAAGRTMGEVKDIPTGWGYDPDQPDRARRQVLPWAPGWERIDDHPIALVSWNDADAFCQWLSRQEGKTYRLPTEAEWEYACRAGTSTRFWCGNDPDELSRIANVPDREMKNLWPGSWTLEIRDGKQTQNRIPFPFVDGTDGYALSAPVGNYPPNSFGLCDMHGNVGEWCRDWYDANYYAQSPVDDPPGPATGSQRVLRGGGWRSYPLQARSAYRSGIAATYRDNQLGFRVVCEPGAGSYPAAGEPAVRQPHESRPNLIVNGSFETPGVALFRTFSAGDRKLHPWVVGKIGVDVQSDKNGIAVGRASNGSQYLDLDGTPGPGQITQSFPTTPGQEYELSFAYANNYPDQRRAAASVRIFDRSGDRLGPVTIGHDTSVRGQLDWSPFTARFVAGEQITSLEFDSKSTAGNGGILLDAVSVTAVPRK
jgi:formylglycine-generating enzyme required for sulfatase activity